jgi:hypothetical protein
MNKNAVQFLLTASLLIFTSLSSAATEPLPQTVARLNTVANIAKQNPSASVNSRVSTEAVSLYKQGKTSAPSALMAVSLSLGNNSPAVGLTLTKLIRAGADPLLMATAGQRAGLKQKEIFVAELGGGVDPANLTASTAAGGQNIQNTEY